MIDSSPPPRGRSWPPVRVSAAVDLSSWSLSKDERSGPASGGPWQPSQCSPWARRRPRRRPRPRPRRSPAAGKPYTPPRTPWGDPQLAGVYSNDDETGVPFERPAQFEGRRIEDISAGGTGRAQQAAQRAVQRRRRRDGVRRRDPSADAPDLRFLRAPEQQPVAGGRSAGREDPAADGGGAAARPAADRPGPRRQQQREPGRAVQQLRGSRALRSLRHARHPQLDDAGRVRQLLRAHSKPGLGRPSLRDDPRAPGDPDRSGRAPAARRQGACTWISATPAAGTRATRWSSRRRISRRAAPIGAPAST